MEKIAEGELPVKRICLSDYVFDELMTLLRVVASDVNDVISFGEELRQSGGFQILKVEEKIIDSAWEIFKKYKEMPKLSFTDCTNVALTKAVNLDSIFTYDKHFAKMGMKIIE